MSCSYYVLGNAEASAFKTTVAIFLAEVVNFIIPNTPLQKIVPPTLECM